MFLFKYTYKELSDFKHIIKSNILRGNNIDNISPAKTGINKNFETLFAKTICAMANTGNSILFLGLENKNLRFTDTGKINDEIKIDYLHSIITNHISPLPEYEIIEFKDENHHIFTIKINNTKAPFQFSDGRFYKRLNTKNQIMQVDELKALIGSQNKPDIHFAGIINTSGVPSYNNGILERMVFFPKFMITNKGNSVEKIYKVNISIPASLHDTEFLALHNYFSHYDENFIVFSIPAKSPLFQNENLVIAEAKLMLTADNFDDFRTEKIYIDIYSSTAVKQSIVDIHSTFIFNKKTIQESDFKTLKSKSY